MAAHGGGGREGETGTDDVRGGGQPPSTHTATQLMLDSFTKYYVGSEATRARPERRLTCCDGGDSCRQVEAVHATPNGTKVWVLGSKASGDKEGTEEQPCTTAPAAAAKGVVTGKGRQASTKAKQNKQHVDDEGDAQRRPTDKRRPTTP
jgi:hypothetical protein